MTDGPWIRKEVIGDATLYLGDCREIVPAIEPCDAFCSDPPYGQAVKVNTFYAGGKRSRAVLQRSGGPSVVHGVMHAPIFGDDAPFDPLPLLKWIGHRPAIVWGAHKFADRMPAGSWLVWDKVPNGKRRNQGDGEAAWTNLEHPLRIYRLLWDGLCVGKGARHEVTAGQQRVHPTQKPEALMAWCLRQIPANAISVCDPYMGAGSTGVAALKSGRRFTGIEIVPEYFEISCRRIAETWKQPRLFAGGGDETDSRTVRDGDA